MIVKWLGRLCLDEGSDTWRLAAPHEHPIPPLQSSLSDTPEFWMRAVDRYWKEIERDGVSLSNAMGLAHAMSRMVETAHQHEGGAA